MLGTMKPFWLMVAAASATLALEACGGSGFTVAGTPDGGTDSSTVGSPDATIQDGAVEAGSSDAQSADDSTGTGGDAATPEAGTDGRPENTDAAVDAGPNATHDASATSDAEWVPDVIDPSPATCDDGFACTPPAPDGWSGPLEVYDGPTAPTTCGPDFEGPVFVGGSAPVANPAMCECTCDLPVGVTCGPVTVPFYPGSTCPAGGDCVEKAFTPSVCTRVDLTADCTAATTSMVLPVSLATGGGCTPVPTKVVPPPAWSVAVSACISGLGNSQASDCTGGDICTRLPSPPYADICIAQAGIVAACPAGRYTDRRVYTAAFDDTRDCAACTCGAVSGATCTSELDVFSSAGAAPTCPGAAQVIYPAPTSCSFIQKTGDFRLQATVADIGSCSASPPAPIGALTGAQPTTFCCLP
jgi:hypothetical protein